MARIIVADDSEDICRLLKRALEKDGHSVTVMYDTRALDEKLCSQAELIILDVMMPGEDGVAACARIRSFTDCLFCSLQRKGKMRMCFMGWEQEEMIILPSPSACLS